MSPALLALLGLGTIGIIAVAASSGHASGGVSGLVQDSEEMSRIFELYSHKRTELTGAELDELAKLNGKAKGVAFQTFAEWMYSHTSEYDSGTSALMWRQTFFLPPGVNPDTGPDMFSVWADYAGVNCTQYMAGGPGGSGICMDGTAVDWFGRAIGHYHQDNVVQGTSDLEAIGKGYYRDFKKIWDAAGHEFVKEIASVASNYPGIGTVVASAVTFLEAVGSGASIEDATVAAGRAAIPSSLRAAYDVGVGLAVNGELDVKAALSVAMAAAISSGAIAGDVLEKYNTMKKAYDDAQAVKGNLDTGLGTLGNAVEVAT